MPRRPLGPSSDSELLRRCSMRVAASAHIQQSTGGRELERRKQLGHEDRSHCSLKRSHCRAAETVATSLASSPIPVADANPSLLALSPAPLPPPATPRAPARPPPVTEKAPQGAAQRRCMRRAVSRRDRCLPSPVCPRSPSSAAIVARETTTVWC